MVLLTQSGHVEIDEANRITWPALQVLCRASTLIQMTDAQPKSAETKQFLNLTDLLHAWTQEPTQIFKACVLNK